MLRATLKSLWARKVRLVLSALSIVLGVAFVCGSLMFTDLLRSSFDQLSGEIHASAKTVLLEDSRYVRDAANEAAQSGCPTRWMCF